MDRRRYIRLGGTVLASLGAGCTSDGGSETGRETSASAPPPQTPDVDTGTVYEGDVPDDREWTVDATAGQTVSVTASDISEGEQLVFRVGDGAAFVHSHTFAPADSGTTDEYRFESDGRHQLRVGADRRDPPMDEAVTVAVTVTLILPAVSLSRISAPRNAEYLHEVTADSTSDP